MQPDFWLSSQRVADQLAQPALACCWRDREMSCNLTSHADLSRGIRIEVAESFGTSLEVAVAEFQKFMHACVQSNDGPTPYRIVIQQDLLPEHPAAEKFSLQVESNICVVRAPDVRSVWRALVHMEDLMTLKQAPHLPLGKHLRSSSIGPRITRSPVAAYRFKTGWELLDDHDYYPDEYLSKLAKCGVNGIWVAGLFRNLVRTEIFPQLGPSTNRLEKLRQLVERTRRYGIDVYLFCMEPRPVSPGHELLKAFPQIQGARVDVDEVCLCTSTPQVQEYLRQAVCELFTQVPHMGGLITIFNGERITNCWLEEQYAQTCPRCCQRKQVDVLAEDLNCFAEGIRRSGSKAKCLAWNYWMSNEHETHSVTPLLELIGRTDDEIVWLANFEHGGRKMLAGQEIPIDEYSLSFTGPGAPFIKVSDKCAEVGRSVYAKLQIGTTFELPSVPYLPLPGVVYDKITALKNCGATGTMLNWIPGGFPSLMLKATTEAAFYTTTKPDFLAKLAGSYWPAECIEPVVSAWNYFERSFAEYPFSNRFLYYGPITRAPAYPLRLSQDESRAYPFNWGIDRHRKTQPFEETIERWEGPLSLSEIVSQLKKMIELWEQGVRRLASAIERSGNSEAQRQFAVAAAIEGHLRCTMHIIEFYKHRRAFADAAQDGRNSHIEAMKLHVSGLITAASKFSRYIEVEPSIGFHSEILDFSYDAALIKSAIRTNKQTLELLDKGVEAVLQQVMTRASVTPPDTSVGVLDRDGD